MAYQPKSYRKFIATAATATLVASAVTPAAAASSFTDVADKYKEAVDYLVDNNITAGKTTTTFGTDEKIIRADVAVWLAKALDLDTANAPDAGFTDVPDRAKGAVNAIKEAGITAGKTTTTFGASDEITRGEMAIWLSKAYDLSGGDVELDFTDVSDRYEAAVKALVANEITAGTSDTTFGTDATIKRGDLAIFLHRAATLEAEAVVPEVVSVSALNNIQAELTFNTALDAKTVVADNFADSDSVIDVASVELVDSNKVLVTFDAAFGNQDSVTLTLNDVKSEGGAVIAEDTEVDVTFFDTTIPKAVNVVSAGPDSFKVIFSEPVDQTTAESVSNYSVNNGQYFIQSATKTGLKEVTVTLYSSLADGEYEVSVKNVQDLAGYKLVDTKLTLTQAADTVAPSVAKVVSASPNKVVLEFNEDVSLNDTSANLITAQAVYHTNSGNTPDQITVDANNSKRVELTFTTNPLPQGGTAYLVVSKDVVVDGWGNKNARYTSNVAVTVDTVKPEVVKLEAPTDASFKLTFSEDVDQTTAETAANYTLLDSTGEEVEGVTVTPTVNADDSKVVDLAVSGSLSGGAYTVVVEKVEDLAGNVISKVSPSVNVKDTTAPTVTATGTLYDNKKIVKISFSEAMATSGSGSVLDLANYQFGGTYLNTTKATASLADNGKAVLIDYSKTSLTIADGNTVTVGKVADASGNFTTSFTTGVTVNTATTVGISKVEATGTKTIVVTLSDSLSKFEADDFIVNQGGTPITPASVSFANVDGKGVITYTLTTAQTLNTDATATVSVETAAANINSENAFGVKVGSSIVAVTAADKIAPTLEKFDHDTNANTADVEDIRISYVDGDGDGKVDTAETATITLNYTEAIDASSLSTLTYDIAGYTVSAITLDTDTSKVVITASANANNTTASPTITQVADIKDDNGVVLVKGGSWTVR
ncbi:hypothetical protein GCM10008967_02660 [Bacillus carboniphilus]|uniref:SLH domain-containing protein n=1 Tax=Bacillus carboniphilus TaxID=86663 RepID=A0ABN0VRK1_9BACI